MFSSYGYCQDQSNTVANTETTVLELSPPWDWLQLTSGEWLKGELLRMEDFVVYFDSDKLDDLKIDWEDVKAIHTSRPMAVLLRNFNTAIGPLRTKDGQLFIEAQNITIDPNDVINIATGSQRGSDLWNGDVTAGTNLRHGNSEEKDVNISIDILRRTSKSSFRTSYVANFSEFEGEENSNDRRINASFDYRFGSKWFWRPVLLEYYRDPFQNIQAQWTVGSGIGYYLIEDYDQNWVFSAGPAYQVTDYNNTTAESEDPVASASLFISTQYDQELTDDIDLKMSYQVIITDEDAGRAKHNTVVGLSVKLTDKLKFTTNLYWDRINQPQVDEDGVIPQKDDYRFTFGLSYEL